MIYINLYLPVSSFYNDFSEKFGGRTVKGLLIALIFIIAIIGVGIGLSAFAHTNYMGDVAVATDNGFEEGFARGYEDGFREGSETGFQEGSRDIYAQAEIIGDTNSLGSYYFLYDPTYDEVMDFLTEEKLETFWEISDYAERNGIHVGYVRCRVAMPSPETTVYVYHLAIFNTRDRGPVVIEPWSHRVVRVEAGETYQGLYDGDNSGGEGIVDRVTVVW